MWNSLRGTEGLGIVKRTFVISNRFVALTRIHRFLARSDTSRLELWLLEEAITAFRLTPLLGFILRDVAGEVIR